VTGVPCDCMGGGFSLLVVWLGFFVVIGGFRRRGGVSLVWTGVWAGFLLWFLG